MFATKYLFEQVNKNHMKGPAFTEYFCETKLLFQEKFVRSSAYVTERSFVSYKSFPREEDKNRVIDQPMETELVNYSYKHSSCL